MKSYFTCGAVPATNVAPQDLVNEPAHYKQGGLEVIDILRAKLPPEQFEGFCRANILKYTLRYDTKNGVEDVQKAEKYIQWLIEHLKKAGRT